MSEERTYKVEMLARVEGEGRFWLKLGDDGAVQDAKLAIFEAPRFFEAFLRGRSLFEVPDIVARICGICPIAYQTSATRALERIVGVDPLPARIRALRRLMYCGEWIESHALHVFMLHAPDFLGFASAIEMAAGGHQALVERGLKLKKAGNRIVEVLGGRAIHPVSPRVGGFTRAPTPEQLRPLRAELAAALELADETVDWTRSLAAPQFEQDYVFVGMVADAYPLEYGDELAISDRGRIHIDDFLDQFEESHVEHSNALQCHLKDGTPYLVGPAARLSLFAEQLHPRAIAALERSQLRLPVRNPYLSIVVRVIELVHALADALDLVDDYLRPPPVGGQIEPAFVAGTVRAGQASGCSEAPRGICWHRYEVDDEGLITEARIVPPTSQNQARIERDLVALAPSLLSLEHAAATLRCEQLIRSYDPCISCATHFLRLEIER